MRADTFIKKEENMIRGELVSIGDLSVDGEVMTGVFINTTRQAIIDNTTNMLYRDVVVDVAKQNEQNEIYSKEAVRKLMHNGGKCPYCGSMSQSC